MDIKFFGILEAPQNVIKSKRVSLFNPPDYDSCA
jgi:hypothetical protein